MGFPLSSVTLNAQLFATALSARWRQDRMFSPDFSLAKEPEIWEKLMREPRVAHAITQFCVTVAGRKWRMLARRKDSDPDRIAAAIMEEVYSECHQFSSARYRLATSTINGKAAEKMHCERRRLKLQGTNQYLEWLVPVNFDNVDERLVEIRPIHDDGFEKRKPIRGNYWLWDVGTSQWLSMKNRSSYVIHIHDDEQCRLGQGRGLREALYNYHHIKGIVMREGLKGLARWAQGFLYAIVDPDREGNESKTNDEVTASWMKLLQQFVASKMGVVMTGEELKNLEMSGTGHQMAMEWLKYLDEGMVLCILGAASPVGAGGGSSSPFQDQAGEEQENIDLRVKFIRDSLDETISYDSVQTLWRHNWHNIVRVGLSNARCPRLSSVPQARRNPKDFGEASDKALNNGADIREDEYYEGLGLTAPSPGDRTIKGRSQQSMGGFGGGGGESGGGSGGPGEPLPPGAGTIPIPSPQESERPSIANAAVRQAMRAEFQRLFSDMGVQAQPATAIQPIDLKVNPSFKVEMPPPRVIIERGQKGEAGPRGEKGDRGNDGTTRVIAMPVKLPTIPVKVDLHLTQPDPKPIPVEVGVKVEYPEARTGNTLKTVDVVERDKAGNLKKLTIEEQRS